MFTKDKYSEFTKKLDDVTGFLHLTGVLARTGLQEYLGVELSSDLEQNKIYKVYRPKDEVLSKDSLESYINAVATDNHPSELVTVDNVHKLGKGSISNIETYAKDGIDYIKAKIAITDKNLINKIKNGKIEISAGYVQDLKKEKGFFKDEEYHFKQTNIRINHIAIVDKGRCGKECKLALDNSAKISPTKINKGANMPKLKIGSVEVETCDTVAGHIQKLETEIKSKDEEVKSKTEELEVAKAEKDLKEKELENEKKRSNDSNIAALVDEKVELIGFAKDGDIKITSSDSILDIKKAIITKVKGLNLDEKPQAYVNACFDMVKADLELEKEKKKKILNSQNEVSKDHQSKKTYDTFVSLADKEI